jgi:hypothetical protein
MTPFLPLIKTDCSVETNREKHVSVLTFSKVCFNIRSSKRNYNFL